MSLGIVLLIAAVSTAYYLNRPEAPTTSSGGSRTFNDVNYGPPNKDEQKAGDSQKDANIAKDELVKNNSEKPQSASIVVVDASQYDQNIEVRAYISNIYEDGGTCTAILTLNDNKVSRTNTAFKDATTTQCGTIEIPRSEFINAGDWSLSLSYNSTSTSGVAKTQKVTIK